MSVRFPSWPETPSQFESKLCPTEPSLPACHQIQSCRDAAFQVNAFQGRGRRKVLVGVGRPNSDTSVATSNLNTFTSPDQGTRLADLVWEMFLGGQGNYSQWRPFGPDVILDGVAIMSGSPAAEVSTASPSALS